MTSKHFEQFLQETDNSLRDMRREIQNRGEDEFDPFLFAKALLLKMRVILDLMGKQIAQVERRESPTDLHYQNEDWMARMNWSDQGENRAAS